MKTRFAFALAAAVLAAGPGLSAQRPSDVVRWSVKAPSTAVSPGGTAVVELTARIEEGWHLYALTQPKGGPNPLKIALAKGSTFTLAAGAIRGPEPQVVTDANFELETRQHDGTVPFSVPVKAADAAPAGAHAAAIEVTFQACGNGICLRPFTQRLPVEITVKPAK